MIIHYTKGLPASGKSTFARNLVANALGHDIFIARINRDDIRAMLGTPHGGAENMVTKVQHAAIEAALTAGKDVIVDDTNFFRGAVGALRGFAGKYRAELVEHDFTDVPVEVCIERDKNREAQVGEEVIIGMARRYGLIKE